MLRTNFGKGGIIKKKRPFLKERVVKINKTTCRGGYGLYQNLSALFAICLVEVNLRACKAIVYRYERIGGFLE